LVLVALSAVEQRLDAVRLVLAGATVTEVAARVGVSRQTLHRWLGRYLGEGVAGLVDRSRRPKVCPRRCLTRHGLIEIYRHKAKRAENPSRGAEER
jgi:transposase-like protein